MRLILILTLLILTACAGTSVKETYAPDGRTLLGREMTGVNPDYLAYLQAAAVRVEPATIDTAACDGDARCVENLSHDATIRSLAAGNRNTLQPPPQRRTAGDRWESIGKAALGIIPGSLGIVASDRANERASESTIAQYQFLGGVVHDVTTASTVVAQSGPTVTINDSYNDSSDNSDNSTDIADSWNSEAGDTVTDSYNGNAGRDQIGRDRVDNSGNIGTENRQDSPGPIDDNSNPGDCDGAGNCTPPAEIDP